jgi:hypothetical protein
MQNLEKDTKRKLKEKERQKTMEYQKKNQSHYVDESQDSIDLSKLNPSELVAMI